MLDEFDREILQIVQRDNRLTNAEIGERVGLSPSAVRRRLAALRESGTIRGDVSLVDPDKHLTTIVVLIRFHYESVEADREFRKQMEEAPEVTQCYSVAGGVDYVLIVQVPDKATYEAWGQRALMSNAAIRRYDSHIVWSRVKFTTAVPVELMAAPDSGDGSD